MSNSILIYSAYLIILAALIAALHMAFRTPQWRRRELLRRAGGDSTVLGVFALVVLVVGKAADWLTFVMLAGGFVIAAAVKVTFSWYDAQRHAALAPRSDDDDEPDADSR